MIICIEKVLEDAERQRVSDLIASLHWRDGGLSAGSVARAVKKNEQADLSSPDGQALSNIVFEAMGRHPVVKSVARPKRFSSLRLSRTTEGGGYGAHVDNAIMWAAGTRLRTDLSFTLFLSDPSDYEGGALAIGQGGGANRVKGAPGSVVLYPSTAIHAVEPVTRGERLVCVGWIESAIPDTAQREVLFDLEKLRAFVRSELPSAAPQTLLLDKTIANLLRMWWRS